MCIPVSTADMIFLTSLGGLAFTIVFMAYLVASTRLRDRALRREALTRLGVR